MSVKTPLPVISSSKTPVTGPSGPDGSNEVKKTFLDDITSFISKNKYSIALLTVITGICVYYYIKSKSVPVPVPVVNDNFGFSDDPATTFKQVHETNEPVIFQPQPTDSQSTTSIDTIEIGENESKIVSMDDIASNASEANEPVKEVFETYKSGPRKGLRKEKKTRTVRRRKK